MTDHDRNWDDDRPRRPGFWQVVQSVLAGAFGVQTNEARKRDFQSGSPVPYVIGGVVFTVLLIAILVVVVNVVLSSAGVD